MMHTNIYMHTICMLLTGLSPINGSAEAVPVLPPGRPAGRSCQMDHGQRVACIEGLRTVYVHALSLVRHCDARLLTNGRLVGD